MRPGALQPQKQAMRALATLAFNTPPAILTRISPFAQHQRGFLIAAQAKPRCLQRSPLQSNTKGTLRCFLGSAFRPRSPLHSLRRISVMSAGALEVAQGAAPASLAGDQPVFAQCMLRVKDAEASRAFYEGLLGMKFLTRLDFDDYKFSLYFFAWTDDEVPDLKAVPQADRAKWLWSRTYPTVELTYNWEDDGEVYVTGNEDPKGFGHLGIVVDDPVATVAKLKEKGVRVVREASDFLDVGVIAFVQDPDGYWIEVIKRNTASRKGLPDVGLVGPDPVFAQTMLRVADPRPAIEFFQRCGLKYIGRVDIEEFKFTLYFLAYTDIKMPPATASRSEYAKWLFNVREPTVELTHNWDSESSEGKVYENGNVKPNRGFGHLGFIVSDIYATVSKLEAAGYAVVRKPGPFTDVAEIAFVAEPSTGYWIEIISRSGEAPAASYKKPLPA